MRGKTPTFRSLERDGKRAPRRVVPQPIAPLEGAEIGMGGGKATEPASAVASEGGDGVVGLGGSEGNGESGVESGRGAGGGGEGGESVVNPLVFQCRACGQLLGDSLAFVGADATLGVVCLARANGVKAGGSRKVDMATGATLEDLECGKCAVSVGCVFRTTPSQFDAFRNNFCLRKEAVTSYQLGVGGFSLEEEGGSEGGGGGGVLGVQGLPGEVGRLRKCVEVQEAELKALRQEMGKVQLMVLTLARFSRSTSSSLTAAAAAASPAARVWASKSANPRVFHPSSPQAPPPTSSTLHHDFSSPEVATTTTTVGVKRRRTRGRRKSPSPSGRRSSSSLRELHAPSHSDN